MIFAVLLLDSWYCWWKKSCTSWHGKYPGIYRVLYIPGGAGILPSTVWCPFFCVLNPNCTAIDLKKHSLSRKNPWYWDQPYNNRGISCHFIICFAHWRPGGCGLWSFYDSPNLDKKKCTSLGVFWKVLRIIHKFIYYKHLFKKIIGPYPYPWKHARIYIYIYYVYIYIYTMCIYIYYVYIYIYTICLLPTNPPFGLPQNSSFSVIFCMTWRSESNTWRICGFPEKPDESLDSPKKKQVLMGT